MEDLPTEYDVIVLGTGFTESLVAAAVARVGKKVLHIDKQDYYGGPWASFSMRSLQCWINELQSELSTSVQPSDEGGAVKESEFVNKTESFVLTSDPHRRYTSVKQCWNIPEEIKLDETPQTKVDTDKILQENSSETNTPQEDSSISGDALTTAEENNLSTQNSPTSGDSPKTTEELNHLTQNSPTSDDIINTPKEDNLQTQCTNPSVDTPNDTETKCNSNEDLSTHSNESLPEGKVESQLIKDTFVSGSQTSQIDTTKQWSQKELTGTLSRKFNIDLAPKLLYSRGPLVELLISSNVARYVEFKCTTRILTWRGNDTEDDSCGKLIPVPCSRSDVFTATSVSLIEKRLLMKFLESCHSCNDNSPIWEEYKDKTFIDFLRSKKLTANLIHFVTDAIAMVPPETPCTIGLTKTKHFLTSLGRFGASPFLFPMYGCGEVPQAFCRLCAVFEGIYILRQGIDAVIMDDIGDMIGVLSKGKRVKCSNLVMEASYAPLGYHTDTPSNCISRGIFITDGSILSKEKEQLTLLRLPADANTLNPITVLEVGTTTGVTPKGCYCVHMICEGNNAENDFKEAVKKLFASEPDSDQPTSSSSSLVVNKPKLLWSLYFNQKNFTSTSVTSAVPTNVHICNGPDAKLDYDAAIAQAREVFNKMYPDEEFLPRAPDPDEIVFDNDGAEPKAGDNFAENSGENSDNNSKQSTPDVTPTVSSNTTFGHTDSTTNATTISDGATTTNATIISDGATTTNATTISDAATTTKSTIISDGTTTITTNVTTTSNSEPENNVISNIDCETTVFDDSNGSNQDNTDTRSYKATDVS